MTGSSLLLLGSSIVLDSGLQLLAGTEGDHAPSGDGDFLARLGVAARTLALVAHVEIAEAGQLHLLSALQRRTDLFKEEFHQILGLTLIQPEFLEKLFGHLSLGERHSSISQRCSEFLLEC